MKPYTPTLTPQEQARKGKFDAWESCGSQWRNITTDEVRIWHPMAVDIGEHCYRSARKLNNGKKIKSRD